MTPPKPKAGTESKGRKKKESQPTQVNPNGVRVKVIGADGKVRWIWQPK